MNKVICDVCGTDYPETAAQCPICGCARADGGQTSAGNEVPGEEEKPAYTYVKGGRFSKSNVRKRLKNSQSQQTRLPEPDYDDEDDQDDENEPDEPDEENEEPASNRGLIVIVILLLLAIIAVSSYIAIEFFGLGKSDDPAATRSTGSTQTSSDPASSTTVGNPVPCTGLTVTDSEIILAGFDTSWQLNFAVEPENTTDELIFTTSDDNVAAVDQDGNVTAVGEGEATITVTCGEFIAQCRVVCDFEDVIVDPSQPSDPSDPTDPSQPSEPVDTVVLKLNREDFTLSAKGASWNVYSGELDPADITWTSGNEEVVTVENGKVVAVGPGRTRIYAEYNGQKVSCWVSCSFPAEEPTEATEPSEGGEEPGETYTLMVNGSVSPFGNETSAEASILVGESFRLTVENSMGAIMQVEWTMSKEGVCSFDSNKVTGVAKGTVTLTATYEGQTFTCKVIVNNPA